MYYARVSQTSRNCKKKSLSLSVDARGIEKDCARRESNHFILIARDYVGLKNLYKLVSISCLEYFYKKPKIPKSLLDKHREGLLIGSACEAGELFRAILNDRDEEEINQIASYYDYFEIQPLGNNQFLIENGILRDVDALKSINRKIYELGKKLNKKVVATCDTHFLNPEDSEWRKILQGGQGFKDADNQGPLFFRNTKEMMEEFYYLNEEEKYEVVIKNPQEISDMTEDMRPVPKGVFPPSIENAENDLLEICEKAVHRIYGENLPDIVEKRFKKEVDCILKYGYAVMYIIAQKLVEKSNKDGYLVGSRGSVGSSFIAFLMGITEINALCPHYVCPKCRKSEFIYDQKYKNGIDMPSKNCVCGEKMKKDGFNIPFETFLGFEGDKVPDIDLNFSGEYQATAHKYVETIFGEGYVFRAGTIGTIAKKTAEMFAKKYYEKRNETIPSYAEIARVSLGSIGVKRTTGQHPGGIIVCPKDKEIYDFCPIQHPADDRTSGVLTTHFDFHAIHDNLLKLDILGHDDPTTIKMLEDLTGVNAKDIPLDDEETMSIFTSVKALKFVERESDIDVGVLGVPEFGTKFVRQMLLDTKPKTFYELILISGLSHGESVWIGNAHELIKSKTATLAEVICVRDDIMIYLIHKGLLEKVSFDITERVRKGKGLTPEDERIMKEKKIPNWYISSCKKIKYMFPKAHAAAYVTMAFKIAYFKVYYPIEFYIAYFTIRADNFDAEHMIHGPSRVKAKLADIRAKGVFATIKEKDMLSILEICVEMYARGINFLPVDLYKSDSIKFLKVGNNILPPLNSLAGLGDVASDNIVKCRKEFAFLSQDDLKQRAKLNKNVMELLEINGCLKGLAKSSQINFLDGI